ncbi:hypothetical protein ACEOWJ_004927 [Bacillus cereus]
MNGRMIFLLRATTQTQQIELADYIGCVQPHLSRMEKGFSPVQPRYKTAIEKFFKEEKGLKDQDLQKISELSFVQDCKDVTT